MSRAEHLVTPTDLAAELESTHPPVVLDVRWHLADEPGAGRQRFAERHIAGARFLDVEAVLTGHTGDPRDGRHPLPDVDALQPGLADAGVRTADDVVVYDEPGSYAADRAWWVLRWAGLHTRVLDGGLPAWVAAGGETETGEPGPWQGEEASEGSDSSDALTLTTGHLPTLTIDEAAAFPSHGTLVDARAPERFRGEVEPLDPRAGHIPGAVNLPASGLYTGDGRLPSDEVLHDQLRRLTEGGPVAAYCGSGVSAARDLLALAVLGTDGALFPGSWSAWSNDPDRVAGTGPD